LPCIKAFPELEALQKKFSGKLQILLVNTANQDRLDSILKVRQIKSSAFKLPKLASITGDKILNAIFPHHSIPHYVWIDEKGVVSSITEGRFVTESNIESKLKHLPISLPEKKDNLEYLPSNALFPQAYDFYSDHLTYYSIIMKHIPGLWGGTLKYKTDSVSGTITMTRGNYSILQLFGDALTNFRMGDPYISPIFDYGKRVILDIKDVNKIKYFEKSTVSKTDWKEKNTYCYEAVIPLSQSSRAYEYMLSDIERYFGLKGSIEKRSMKCLALICTSKEEKFKFKGVKYVVPEYIDSNGTYHLYGTSKGFYVFRNSLAQHNMDKPYVIVDNTGYTGKVELEINAALSDIDKLRKELRGKYGLDLVEIEQDVDVMIISDKGNK
jgi:hypothetical protein